MNRSTLRIGAIVAAAVAITAIATAAVTAAVTGDAATLSPDDVNQLLAEDTTAPGPTATGTTQPEPTTRTGADGTVSSLAPGTVTVRCADNLATLVSWSPNPGYRADDAVRGPAHEVSIRFENDASDADYKVTAVCGPEGVAVVTLAPDDHSGRGRN
jgi:hypothetical protein